MGDTPTKDEVRAGYQAAMAFAMAVTKSKARAEEAVQQAFESLYAGVREWRRAKVAFDVFAIGATRSIISNERKAKREERASKAAEIFQADVGTQAASAEDRTLAHAEEVQRLGGAGSELDALDASIGDHEDAREVLRCRRGTDEPLKAAEIARCTGIPVGRVYRANELLSDHLKKLRARRE